MGDLPELTEDRRVGQEESPSRMKCRSSTVGGGGGAWGRERAGPCVEVQLYCPMPRGTSHMPCAWRPLVTQGIPWEWCPLEFATQRPQEQKSLPAST